MTKQISILIFVFFIISCSQENGIDDYSKRNENWAWWVDIKTGVGKWLPINGGGQEIMEEGIRTLFYTNGSVRQKGRRKNGAFIDTISLYSIRGELIVKELIYDKDSFQFFFAKDGKYEINYPTLELHETSFVKNGKLNGLSTELFKNGKKAY